MAFVDSWLVEHVHPLAFRGPMLSFHAQAIRSARVAVGLTQEQLGRRVGVSGRAIYRWERDAAVPTRRNRTALVTAVAILNQAAGDQLKAALEQGPAAPVVPAATTHFPRISVELALNLAVLGLAEALDVSPRLVRAALPRFSRQLRDAGVTLDALCDATSPSVVNETMLLPVVPS